MNRILSLALGLLALAGPLAGCDATADLDEVYTGPLVQFGTSSLTVGEGATAELPVTLTGATPGQTVTVEVLFAAGSSSACGEDDTSGDNAQNCDPALSTPDDTTLVDFTGFGTASTNDNRVQTVTLTAGPDGTATAAVSFTVRNEGAIEGAQTAVFALQNVDDGVRIGANSQASVLIGTLPLSTIRQLPDNAPATVEGVVTRSRGRLTYIQDDTGAIAIFSPVTSPFGLAVASGEIEPGDRIQVAGRIDIFNGLTELVFVTAFAVTGDDVGVPAAQTVSLATLTGDLESYESELVRVPNLTFNTTDIVFDLGTSSGRNYTVTDPTGTTYTLRAVGGSDGAVNGTPIPTAPATFTGIVGQFNTGQLLLTRREDLVP